MVEKIRLRVNDETKQVVDQLGDQLEAVLQNEVTELQRALALFNTQEERWQILKENLIQIITQELGENLRSVLDLTISINKQLQEEGAKHEQIATQLIHQKERLQSHEETMRQDLKQELQKPMELIQAVQAQLRDHGKIQEQMVTLLMRQEEILHVHEEILKQHTPCLERLSRPWYKKIWGG